MLVKNISGRPRRILSVHGEQVVGIDGPPVEISPKHFDPRVFVEVDANGNPKSADVKAYITEDDKRVQSAVVEPVASVAPVVEAAKEPEAPVVLKGKSEAIVDIDAAPKPLAPQGERKEKKINTTASVLGRPPKKLV